MKISILCPDEGHPVNIHLERWISRNEGKHEVSLARKSEDLDGGDFLFLISCSTIVRRSHRSRYSHCLVLHASELPLGRGWSPHVWQILAGASEITLSMLEAESEVDSGRIWLQQKIPIGRHLLIGEINELLFDAELNMLDRAIAFPEGISPKKQSTEQVPDYYPRRTPADSRLDPEKSIASQFDLIRVCDAKRFPAFFELRGHTFRITLERIDDPNDKD